MVCTTRNSPVTNTSSRHGSRPQRSAPRSRTAKAMTTTPAQTGDAMAELEAGERDAGNEEHAGDAADAEQDGSAGLRGRRAAS